MISGGWGGQERDHIHNGQEIETGFRNKIVERDKVRDREIERDR